MQQLSSRIPSLKPAAGPALGLGVLPYVLCVGFAFLMHFAVGPIVGDFAMSVLLQAGIAIVLAVSLNIINGFTGQFSIGHAGFMAVGGYVAGSISYYTSMILWNSPAPHGGFLGSGQWLMALGCVVGGAAAAGCGYLVGLPSLRLRGDYLAIVTLGFGEIIRVLLQRTQPLLFTREEIVNATASQLFPPPFGGAQGFERIPNSANLFWVFLATAITVVFAVRLKHSSSGRAFLSIREDEIAARAMGVNITKYKVRAFVLAAFFAGIAGGLYAHVVPILRPIDAGFQKSFEVIIMVVLGGMGSVSGVILAAIILTILPELLRDFAQYRLIIYALLLIVMMIVRPQGLFGVREIWDYFPFAKKRSRAA
ncbi:MAG TPA: branched-chain amino acid ABC transporter permease [Phycisphaerales bacterium]|nr:branched-chain amino acid ABC transporter permease [Phycisphaerales bacterium]